MEEWEPPAQTYNYETFYQAKEYKLETALEIVEVLETPTANHLLP